jgi:predicted homoserine dehydrogenase-like protein
MELISKLRQREAGNNPVRVGIIGCGQMGSGLAHTLHNIRGMQVNAIADIQPELAINTFLEMDVDRNNIVVTEKEGSPMTP